MGAIMHEASRQLIGTHALVSLLEDLIMGLCIFYRC